MTIKSTRSYDFKIHFLTLQEQHPTCSSGLPPKHKMFDAGTISGHASEEVQQRMGHRVEVGKSLYIVRDSL
jgi:hypothetical protein